MGLLVFDDRIALFVSRVSLVSKTPKSLQSDPALIHDKKTHANHMMQSKSYIGAIKLRKTVFKRAAMVFTSYLEKLHSFYLQSQFGNLFFIQ